MKSSITMVDDHGRKETVEGSVSLAVSQLEGRDAVLITAGLSFDDLYSMFDSLCSGIEDFYPEDYLPR